MLEEKSKGAQQASGTAVATAFMRALAACDERQSIRGRDNLAVIFLPDDQRQLLSDPATRAWVLQEKVAPGAYAFMIARTAYFDEAARQALQEDLAQIVMLGAGYDSRAYRFANLIHQTLLFELETASTQARKLDCLRQAAIAIPEHVRFVPIRLGADDLFAALRAAGYSSDKPTLFLWEGVTYYLGAEIVNGILSSIRSNAAAGSLVCFDYAAISHSALEEKGAKELRGLMQSEHADEPARFGIPAGEIANVLGSKGFAIRNHLTATEMQARYLPGIESKEIGKIPELFCLVCAEIK